MPSSHESIHATATQPLRRGEKMNRIDKNNGQGRRGDVRPKKRWAQFQVPQWRSFAVGARIRRQLLSGTQSKVWLKQKVQTGSRSRQSLDGRRPKILEQPSFLLHCFFHFFLIFSIFFFCSCFLQSPFFGNGIPTLKSRQQTVTCNHRRRRGFNGMDNSGEGFQLQTGL